MIYVAGHTPIAGPIKIGYTGRPKRRVSSFRYNLGVWPEAAQLALKNAGLEARDLRVLYSSPGDRTLERALHGRLATYQLVGEWFLLGDDPERIIEIVRQQVAMFEISPTLGVRPQDVVSIHRVTTAALVGASAGS